MAVGILEKVGDGVGKVVAQAAEDRTAMEGIDRMAQDESDGSWRREADRYKLLTEYVVREIVIRRMIIPDDPIAIAQMPTHTPLRRRSRNTPQIPIPCLPDDLCFMSKHP